MKPIEIYLAIYRCTVVVFCGHTSQEMKSIIKKKLDLPPKWYRDLEDITEENIGGATTTLGEKNRDVIVYLKKIPKVASEFGVLYHELYHAVDLVMSGIDKHNLCYDKDGMSEPRAYLYQYLVDKCHNVLWDKVDTSNKGRIIKNKNKKHVKRK